MNMVQQSLLKWIDEQEEHERLGAYETYYDYYYGKIDALTSLPIKIKESLGQQLTIIANFCKIVVDAKVQYITGKPCSITVSPGIDGNTEDPRIAEAEKALYHIYNLESNGMLQENMNKLVSITSMKGDGFIKLFHDESIKPSGWGYLDQIQIRALNPSHVFPKYKDDDYQQIECVAIKIQGYNADRDPIMKMQVFYPDRIERYETKGVYNTQAMTWELIDTQENPDGFIPIQHVKNTVTDLAYGVSDLHVAKDFQDAINKTITDMMCTMDQQAFQRLWTAGAIAGKEPINMSPGSVIEFLDADSSLHVIEPGAPDSYLAVLTELIDDMLMVCQIPKVAAGRADGGGLSGYALRVQYLPLESKASPLREILRNQFRSLNNKIFNIIYRLSGNMVDYRDLEATVDFQDGLPIDEVTDTQNVIALKGAGIISNETAMQRVHIEDTKEEQKRIDNETNAEIYGSPSRVTQEANAVANALQGVTVAATPQEE